MFGTARSVGSSANGLTFDGGSAGSSVQRAWARRTWLVTIPLALVVIYAFIPVLHNDFIRGADDDDFFVNNPYIRGFGAAQLKWAWTNLGHDYYHPLAWMFYSAQYLLWQLDPRGYHMTSLLLEVVDAVMLYTLTLALLVRCRNYACLESAWARALSAGFATALFAVHPLRVEAVAWAVQQPYLSAILFSILSVLAYLRAFPMDSLSTPKRGWLVGSFLLFVVALLFYPVTVSLPAALLILDVYPLRRFPDVTGRWFVAATRRALLEKVPFVMASLVLLGLTMAASGTRIPVGGQGAPAGVRIPVDGQDASAGIARACYATWFYLLKTVLPLNLNLVYVSAARPNWLVPPYNVSIIATVAMSVGLFLLRRRWPGLLASWLIYLVMLAPCSGFVVRYTESIFVADRYSGLSTLSLVMVAAAGFCCLWHAFSRWYPGAIALIAIGLGAVVGLTAMTRDQCRIWLNTDTLSTHVLAHGANSSDIAHLWLAFMRRRQGKYAEAEAHLAESLRLNPDNATAHMNLGTMLSGRGKYAEAETHFAEAARLDPEGESAHNSLGKVLYAGGKDGAAVAEFTEALRLNPGDADAHNNLGVVLDKQGKHEEAVAHFNEALRLNPGFADAHKNLATVLASRGKYAEAEAQYAEVARLNPRDDKAQNNLGKVLSKREKYAEAGAHFTEALRLNPGSVDAHYNLGLVFSHVGNYEAARAHYAEAIRLQPGDPRPYNASAMLMAACPQAKFRDGKGAVQFATRACELTEWKNPIILDTLAAAQAEAGDFNTAVKSQKKAIELLTDERQKNDYRSRLAFYQAKRPYRQASPQRAPSEANR